MDAATVEEKTAASHPSLQCWQRARSVAVTHSFVIFLLALSLFTRLLWAGVTPLWQTPDEIGHFAYVQTLGENLSIWPEEKNVSQEISEVETLTTLGGVPFHPEVTQQFSPRTLDGPREDEVHDIPRSLRTAPDLNRPNAATDYPPGYYLLGSVVYRLTAWSHVFTIMFSLRVLSTVISTVTMLISYLTLKRLFDDPRLVQASSIVIALLPMYAFMGMAVNPDVAVWLVFAAFLYLVVKAFDEGLSSGVNLGIAATMVAGLWVKQSFLIALPIYGLLLGFLLLKRTVHWRQAVQNLSIVLFAVGIFSAWLYFGGEVRTSAEYPGGVSQERSISGFIRHFDTYGIEYGRTFDSFWGTFGWLDTRMSDRIYDLIRLGTVLAAVGLVFHLVSTAVRRDYDLKAIFLVMICLGYTAALICLNYIRVTSGEGWFLQGRYLFLIVVPIIALLVKGAVWFAPGARYRDAMLIAMVAAMMLFHTEALLSYVVPRYYL